MKFELVQPEQIQMRESQGLVKDIYDPLATVRQPLSEYRVMLDLIHRDNTLATCYDIVVESTTYRGFDFIRGTKEQREKLRFLFEHTLNFKQILPNLIYSLLYYGDAFLELRRNASSVPNELWVLETTEMRIAYDIHGKIVGYVQRNFDMANLTEEQVLAKELEPVLDANGKKIKNADGSIKTMGVFFSPEEVIHFRMKWIGSQVYSYNPNEPISIVSATKLYAGNYLMNIFMNMPPRYVAHLAGISKADYDKAKSEFQSAKTNYKKVIAFSRSSDPNSKLQIQKIDPPYDPELINIMKWLNNEIVKLTRVPRTWVEESGVENRGVGESIQIPFEIHVHYIHNNILEPEINRALLKALGEEVKDNKSPIMKFNEISRKGENEILMNAGLLRDMGMKPKALVKYLDERGILGTDPDDFEEMQTAKNMELNPSRARMNPNVKNMTQNRNESGVSKESGKKMEAEA